MSLPVCCFPLEIKVRDPGGAVFLGLKFLARGHDCIIGRNAEVNAYLPFINRPFCYFEGGAALDRLDAIDRVHSLGGLSFSLLNEGGIFEKDMRGFKCKFSRDYIDRSDALFLWGETQRSLLLEAYGPTVKEKLFAFGHPRFDLCRQDRIEFFRDAPSPASRHDEGFILVNLSSAHYTHHLGKQALFDKLSGVSNAGYTWDHFNSLYEYQKRRFPVFCNMVRRLSREFPDREIILRPHPDENRELYRRELQGVDRVHITCTGSVLNWIARSSVVVHHDCTTALEALMLGKPVLSYCEVFDENLVQYLPVKVSPKVYSQDKLVAAVRACLEGREHGIEGISREDQLSTISKVIRNVDFEASDRIVAATRELAERLPMQRTVSVPGAIERARRRMMDLLAPISEWKNRKNIHYIRQANKFSTLRSVEMESFINTLSAFVQDVPAVHYRRLGRNLYHLYTKM